MKLSDICAGVDGNQSQQPLLSQPTISEPMQQQQQQQPSVDVKPLKNEYQPPPPPAAVSPKIGAEVVVGRFKMDFERLINNKK